MRNRRVLVLAACVWACLAHAVGRADDAANVLAQCRRACESIKRVPPDTGASVNHRNEAYVCLERRDGTWQIQGFSLTAPRLTDSDVAELTALTTLEDLGLGGSDRATSEGFRQLAALLHLRRFGTPWSLTAAESRALSTLPKLEELVLVSDDNAKVGDEGLMYLTNLRRLR